MGMMLKASSEELRVRSEELRYAFLLEKLLLSVITMTVSDQGIAKQCKPNLLPAPSYLLSTQGVFQ